MKDKNRIDDGMREALRQPFPDEALSQHPTKKYLTTIKAMYITERLNDVFGLGRWRIDHLITHIDEENIVVEGVFDSLDYEVSVSKQYGGSEIMSKQALGDAYKSAVTDCQSKVASLLEVGIDVFKGLVIPGKSATIKDSNEKVEWLTDEQYKKALGGTIVQIKAVINKYSGKNEKGTTFRMKKEFNEGLTHQIARL